MGLTVNLLTKGIDSQITNTLRDADPVQMHGSGLAPDLHLCGA
jgi:hypothetical protein